eukprot:g1497.t1
MQSTAFGVVKVCVRPGDGGWMMTGDGMEGEATTGALHAVARKDNPAVFRGAEIDRLKGFESSMLALVMKSAGISQYEVHAYQTLNQAIIATGRDSKCDLVFGMHTQTPQRAWCANVSSASGIPSCEMLSSIKEDRQKSNQPSPKPCCVDFGTPIADESIGLIVKTPVYQQNLTGALFNAENLNIIAMVICAIVVSAHVVWLAERNDNPEQFPPDYLDGIDDAIWWSAATISTVGYGDKAPLTNTGRIFALVWMFAG